MVREFAKIDLNDPNQNERLREDENSPVLRPVIGNVDETNKDTNHPDDRASQD